MTELSIIIVSWNAKTYILECLTSLRAATSSLRVEIIVVDNASSDGSVEEVRAQFPDVKLIEAGSNLGFAKANNIGMKAASGRHVALINSDVNVPPNCLPTLIRHMEQFPQIGLIGPRMLSSNGEVRRSTMKFPTIWDCFVRAIAFDTLFKGTGLFSGFLNFDLDFTKVQDVDVLNGWFWMTRREALQQVGGLDEQFFMYGEDMDWCKRFHQAGWRVVFFPEAEAIHYGGASSANAPVRFYVEMQRANLQYWKKHHGPTSLLLYWLTVWLNNFIRTTGYALVYLWKRSSHSQALLEIRRNLAGLRSLMGLKAYQEVDAR